MANVHLLKFIQCKTYFGCPDNFQVCKNSKTQNIWEIQIKIYWGRQAPDWTFTISQPPLCLSWDKRLVGLSTQAQDWYWSWNPNTLPDVKSWLICKNPDAGKDWRQEKGTTEDEMVGCHYLLNEHKFEHDLGDGEGQGSLVCCSPWVENSQTWLRDWTTVTTTHAQKGSLDSKVRG